MNSLFCLTVANQGATSWVLHRTGGSIKTRVEEQSLTRAERGTFFTGEHLIWVNYWACVARPGSWAHVSGLWEARASQTDRQTGLRLLWRSKKTRGVPGISPPRNIWLPLICLDRQSAEQDKDGPCWLDQRNSSTKNTWVLQGNLGCNQTPNEDINHALTFITCGF